MPTDKNRINESNETTKTVIEHFKEFYEQYLDGIDEKDDVQISTICPFHDDHNPSFSVNLEEGLWTCHAGCGEGNATKFAEKIGASIEEVPVFLDKDRNMVYYQQEVYVYADEAGEYLFESVRYFPKTFRFRCKDETGGYIHSIKGIRRVPYKLKRLLKAIEENRTIIIVEGEKDVNNVRKKLKFASTCNPGGAGSWINEFRDYFIGAKVVVVPDNDEAGREHASQVASSLMGVAKSVKILELPDLPPAGDISDWIDGGGTREQLLKMAKAVPEYTPPPGGKTVGKSATTNKEKSGGGKFCPITADELIRQVEASEGFNPSWIWEGIIPKGGFVLIGGNSKSGKSTLIRHLLKAINEGSAFLGYQTTKVRVLWIGLEERRQDVARRFKNLGIGKDIYYQPLPFRAKSGNMRLLESFIKDKGVELIITDSLGKFWDLESENNASEVEAAMESFLTLIQNTGATMLFIHHLRKSPAEEGGDLRGSTALMAASDVAMLFRRNRENETVRQVQFFSRYDETPQKLTIKLENGVYQSIADVQAEIERTYEIMRVLSELPQTAKEIGDHIYMPETSIRRELDTLANQSPAQIIKEGAGTRGNPFTYRLATVVDSTTKEIPKGGGEIKAAKESLTQRKIRFRIKLKPKELAIPIGVFRANGEEKRDKQMNTFDGTA